MIEQEVMEADSPEIYMDVSWATQYALSQLVQSENIDKKPLVCHQLVNLRSTECFKDEIAESFRILHQVLPYAFVFQKEYDIRYTYVTRVAEDQKYSVWPHYIVTHRHVFLCSEDKYHAMLLSNEQIAQCYWKELEQMMQAYRPLFTYQGMSGEGIRRYRQVPENGEKHVTYEGCPCVALMIPEEQKKELKSNPVIGQYADAYFEVPNVDADQHINLFGMRGMEHFVQTGHLPGIFDNYYYVESIEERRKMLENFQQHLLKLTRRFYMIKEEKSAACGEFGVEMWGKNKVIFYSISKDFPFGFITIDEPGICEVFSNYFENLLNSESVYSPEDTIIRYEELVESYFDEIE